METRKLKSSWWWYLADTKVIHHQDEGDGTRDMAKKTGGRRFMEAVSGEVRDETGLGELTRLL